MDKRSKGDREFKAAVSRRTLLQAGAGLVGGTLLPSGLVIPAFAADHPPKIGRAHV